MSKETTRPVEIRSLAGGELRSTTNADGTRTLTGLIPYNSRSVDMGGWQEIVAPGAFGSALAVGADVLCLRDHDQSILLGRTKSGTLTLTDTPSGLQFECKLPDTQAARDLTESVARGDLDSNSFGFVCLNADWTIDDNGMDVRTLTQVDLMEISPTSFPAYASSSVALRSVATPKDCPMEIRSKIQARNTEPATQDSVAPAMETSADEIAVMQMRCRLALAL